MENLIIYLIKSAGLLSIFFVAYYFLLRKSTSFRQNRWFLLGGILSSFLLPLLKFTRTVLVENTVPAVNLTASTGNPVPLPQAYNPVDWWNLAGMLYLMGIGFFLLRFLIQVSSLLLLLYRQPKTKHKVFTLVNTKETIQPFSFFRYIVVNPALHSEEELEMILQHEKAHVSQWHSLDVLLVNLSQSILWFNPLSWLYKQSTIQNLEFLADQEALSCAPSKKAYQKTLLKVSVADFQPVIANQFYQSFIKKRIIMLNKTKNQKSTFWRAGLVLPLLAGFIFFFNVETEAQVINSAQTTGVTYQNEVEISATISKHSGAKHLEKIEKLFKKRGVDLKFSKLEYSDEGLLTNIAIQFTKPETNQSGSLSLNNPEGIGSTVFYSNDNEIGFREAEDDRGQEKSSASIFSEIGKNPLFIIGNKEYRARKLWGKIIEVKGKINVLNPNEATATYGNKAKDGAIILPEGPIVDDFKAALKETDLSGNNVSLTYIEVEKDRAPILLSVKTKITSIGKVREGVMEPGEDNIQFSSDMLKLQESDFIKKYAYNDIIAIQRDDADLQRISFQEEKPLIIVEGEIKKADFNINSIDPENIESMAVLKGESATKKYGEQAENGAVEIELKNPGKETKEKASIQFIPKMENYDASEKSSQESDVLYVVDGKIMPADFDPDSISPEEIASINVLKGEQAVEKYGKKARKGVIEITTKE